MGRQLPSQFCHAWTQIAAFVGTPNDGPKVRRLYGNDTDLVALDINGLTIEQIKSVIRSSYDVNDGGQCL